jgi:hypothetical protein
MSTKTTFKRVALVTVAALGFGVLSTAPSSAAQSALSTEYITSIAVSTNQAPVAGSNGTLVTHSVYFKTSAATTRTYNPKVILSSAPATSVLAEGAGNGSTYTAASTASAQLVKTWQFATSSGGSTYSSDTAASATANESAGVNGTNAFGAQYLHVRYDVAGTYTWTFWDDLNVNGRVDGTEFSTNTSVVVSGATASSALKATVSAYNAESSTKGTAYGSLVKITLTDAAGNPANVDTAGGILVTASNSAYISYVNAANITDSQTYTLGATDFDGSGHAWINVVDATAEVATVTLSGVGSASSSFTAPAATFLTYTATCAASCSQTLAASATSTVNTVSTVRYVTSGASVTASFKDGNSSLTVPTTIQLADVSGKIFGKATAAADLVLYGSATAASAGAFSIASAFTAPSQTYTLTTASSVGAAAGGSAQTVTATAATNGAITLTQSVIKAATGAAVTITGTLADSFTAGASNVTITPSISGRNSALVLSTLVTASDGTFTFTYTDASTSTTSLSDTITFTPATGTAASATVTRTTTANLGVATILVSTPSTNSYAATTNPGLPTTTKSFSEISAAKAGASGGAVTVYALVTDASANAIEGVPVTWSVTGTGCAIKSTMGTTYTGNDGVASNAGLYAWVSGDCTVSATYGTVSDTAVSSWRQTGEARTISAAVSGQVVTATVKDRYGNPVVGSAVSATRTGTGYFANGTSSVTNALTGNDGTVDIIVVGSAVVTVLNGATTDAASYGDDIAVAGYVGTSAVTASVAGTATTAETGVGASLAPAGIHSATATVDAAVSEAATAADAAAEATDAANAATDAANAAAEAADAATAAAQDAADAVAALSAQVATLISGLKSQLTALTNLVIKIQKKVKA